LQHLKPDCDDAARCLDALLAEEPTNPLQTAPVIHHPSGEVIEQVLRRSAYASILAIKARIEHNVVVLHGNVPSFYHRQLALATAMKYVPGIFIVDFIEVDSA